MEVERYLVDDFRIGDTLVHEVDARLVGIGRIQVVVARLLLSPRPSAVHDAHVIGHVEVVPEMHGGIVRLLLDLGRLAEDVDIEGQTLLKDTLELRQTRAGVLLRIQ